MRMNGNDLAACAVIALGVGGVVVGSLLGVGNQAVPLPAINPQPVVVDMPAEPEPTATPEPTPEPTPTVETVHFSATGDDLIHDGIFLQAKERGGDHYDFDAAYAAMQGYYDQFDVNWLNQETLVNDEFAASGYPMFSTPGEITDTLYNLGFRVFSLSNNHSYDKGAAGIEASMAHWAAMPDDVVTMGFYNLETYDNYAYQTVNGITFGYLSYTEHTNGIRQNKNMTANVIYTSQTDVIEHQVRLARQQADFVVVGVHWGVENSHAVVDSQRTLAQNLADWGADVIVGTHPHVLQDAQWLTAADGRRSFVAFSLGNFLSTQSHPDQLVGAILTLQLQKTTQPNGSVQCEVLAPQLHLTVTHYDAGKSNVRTYLLRDYTQELAAAHGVRANYSDFSLDRIQKIAQNNIGESFLALT